MNGSIDLIRNACQCIDCLCRKDRAFEKRGIILSRLVLEQRIQANSFDSSDREKSRRLMLPEENQPQYIAQATVGPDR